MRTPKIIILEGPDGAGKTTLAKTLASMLPTGAKILHEGVLPVTVVEPYNYYNMKMQEAMQLHCPVILDRFHIGQYVYGPMWRADFRFTRRNLLLLSDEFSKQGVDTYLVIPPFAEALKNYKIKIEAKDDYLNNVNAWYESYYRFKSLGFMFPEFDYTQNTAGQLLAGELR